MARENVGFIMYSDKHWNDRYKILEYIVDLYSDGKTILDLEMDENDIVGVVSFEKMKTYKFDFGIKIFSINHFDQKELKVDVKFDFNFKLIFIKINDRHFEEKMIENLCDRFDYIE